MEGKHRQFEKKPGQGQQQTGRHHGMPHLTGNQIDQPVDVHGAGCPVNQGQTEKHDGRCTGPHQKIAQARSHPQTAVAAQKNQEIQRVAGQFQGQDQGQQVHRRGQEHHGQGTDRQQKKAFSMVPGRNTLEIVAQEDDQKKADGQEHLDHLGEKIHTVDTVEQVAAHRRTGQAGRNRDGGHGDPQVVIPLPVRLQAGQHQKQHRRY